jgi:hypothetical protein
MSNAYRILVGKPEGKGPLWRPRYRLENNIKIDIERIVWECVDWIYLVQNTDHLWAVVNTVMNCKNLAFRYKPRWMLRVVRFSIYYSYHLSGKYILVECLWQPYVGKGVDRVLDVVEQKSGLLSNRRSARCWGKEVMEKFLRCEWWIQQESSPTHGPGKATLLLSWPCAPWKILSSPLFLNHVLISCWIAACSSTPLISSITSNVPPTPCPT